MGQVCRVNHGRQWIRLTIPRLCVTEISILYIHFEIENRGGILMEDNRYPENYFEHYIVSFSTTGCTLDEKGFEK